MALVELLDSVARFIFCDNYSGMSWPLLFKVHKI